MLNIGFAINRALVYGVVSVLLLVFGLIEWAVERFLPMREHVEANILLNAGVALGIFLIFHRVRDFVETFVEKLLFSSWHHNEAHLRDFVRQASFIGKSAVLTSAFMSELERFSPAPKRRCSWLTAPISPAERPASTAMIRPSSP
ncbi:MAG: hypothetical protein WDN06_08810 [Asticcacaulis sp.]